MKGFRDVRGERKRREKRSELSYYKKKNEDFCITNNILYFVLDSKMFN